MNNNQDDLDIHNYFTYVNALTLVHLSVFEFASIYSYSYDIYMWN